VASSFPLHLQPVAFLLAAAVLPAAILIRHARLRPSRPREWLLEGCRLALSTLLILAAFLSFVMLITEGEVSLFATAVGGAGALILTLSIRSLGRGTVLPYIRGADHSYRRDREPVRYWLSLSWNTALGLVFLAMPLGAAETNRVYAHEDSCFVTLGSAPPARVDAACTLLLAEAGLDPARRGFAHHFRAGAREELGRLRDSEADTRAAISAYGEALSESPGSSGLYFNSGLAFWKIGAFRPAREAFDAFILLEPDNGDGFLNRGFVQIEEGRFSDAVQDFTRAAERKPGEASPIINRGIAYAWLGNVAAARADLAEGRRLDPADTGVLRGEALLALKAGEEERALAALTEAVQRDPHDRWSAEQRNEILRGRDRAFAAAEKAGG
jgi:Tfp pilus assembly protein PilF